MTTTPNRETTPEAYKTLVRRWFDELWTDGSDEDAAEIVTSDSAFYDPVSQGVLPATHEAHFEAYRHAFPDLTFTIEELIAEDDTVATRFTATGTQEGEFLDVPPTGESFEIEGIVLTRIENGRIVESRPVWDVYGLMNQLGVTEMSG